LRSNASGAPAPAPLPVEEEPASAASLRSARLIRKVYEVDPLVCPDCRGPMRVVSIITEDDVIYRILAHLGLLEPEPPPHPPPRDLERAFAEVASEGFFDQGAFDDSDTGSADRPSRRTIPPASRPRSPRVAARGEGTS
jgi:hypothetical protein